MRANSCFGDGRTDRTDALPDRGASGRCIGPRRISESWLSVIFELCTYIHTIVALSTCFFKLIKHDLSKTEQNRIVSLEEMFLLPGQRLQSVTKLRGVGMPFPARAPSRCPCATCQNAAAAPRSNFPPCCAERPSPTNPPRTCSPSPCPVADATQRRRRRSTSSPLCPYSGYTAETVYNVAICPSNATSNQSLHTL